MNQPRTRGYLVRLYMARAGLRSVDVMAKIDVCKATVANWRAGQSPVVGRLQEVADLLGMSDAELGEYVRAGVESGRKA